MDLTSMQSVHSGFRGQKGRLYFRILACAIGRQEHGIGVLWHVYPMLGHRQKESTKNGPEGPWLTSPSGEVGVAVRQRPLRRLPRWLLPALSRFSSNLSEKPCHS